MSLFRPKINKLQETGNVKKLMSLLKNKETYWRNESVKVLDTLKWSGNDEIDIFYYLVAKKEWDELLKWEKYPMEALLNTLHFHFGHIKNEEKLIEILVRSGKSIVPHLIKMLKSKDETAKHRAIKALGEIRDQIAVEPLLNLIKYNCSFCIVEAEVMAALGKIGDKSIIKKIIPYLEHHDGLLRKETANCLGKLRWEPSNNHEKALFLAAKRRWKDLAAMGEEGARAMACVLEEKRDQLGRILVSKTLMEMDQCNIELKKTAANVYFSYRPQNSCLICGITFDTQRKLAGLVKGDDLLQMLEGKGSLVEKTPYQCRGCGVRICTKCAQTSKCKVCNSNVFDIV